MFTASSSISRLGATACTISSSPISVSVGAQYYYIDVYTTKVSVSISAPSTRTGSVSCGFTAPKNCRSVKIQASHSASSSNGETWTGATQEIY